MSKILNILSKIFVGLIALFAVLFSSCSFFKFKTSCGLLGLSTYREVSSGVGVVIEDGLDVTTGELKLFENLEEGSDFISIKVPINLDGSISYTLPVEAGRKDYVLTWQEGNIMQWKDISSLSLGGAGETVQVVIPPKEILENEKEVKDSTTTNNNTCSSVICAITADIDLHSDVAGILSLQNGGTGSSLEGPGEDRILFWDESAGKVRWLKVGDNLDIDDRTLSAENSGEDGEDSPVITPPSTGYTGEIYTAGNGLVVSSSIVELGGNLTKNTTISQGDMNMIFNLTGAGDFDIQDNGVSSLYVSGSSGNVGIGTTNPGEQLDVVGGNIRTDNDLIAGGAVFGYATGSGVTDRLGGSAKFMTGTGYIYFDRNNSDVTMDETTGDLSGHAYSDDLGWIDFGEDENPSGPVNVNLTSGSVTGKAYVLTSGSYVDFTNYSSNVSVNLSTGVFSGYVWAEEAGWVDFSDSGVYFSNNTITTFAADQNLYINPEGDGVTFISGNLTIDGTAYAQALDIAGNIELNEYLYFGNGSTEYLRWDGSDFILSDDFLPSSSASLNLGSDEYRWGDLYLDGATLHIGSSTASEGLISYASNVLGFETSSTAVDIAFFTDDLYIDKSLGYLGIGTTAPDYELDVLGTIQAYNFINSAGMPVNDILLEQEVRNLSITAMTGSLGLDMAQFVEKVSETTFNAGVTEYPSATTLTNGNFLIAYTDISSSDYGNFVIYDSLGNEVVSETTFNASTTEYISATILTNGNILIAYKDGTYGNFVIYDSAGNLVKSETTFNAGTTTDTSLTTLTNGNFLIAYRDQWDHSYGKFVIYDNSGNQVKPPTVFNNQEIWGNISSVTLTNGNVLIAYSDGGNSWYCTFVIYDSLGNQVKSATVIENTPVDNISAVTLTNGNILIAYKDDYEWNSKFVIYDTSGNQIKPPTVFTADGSAYISTTTLTNGGFIIAYQNVYSLYGMFVVYDSSGNEIKPPTVFENSRVNGTSVTTLTNGNILVAYAYSYGNFVIYGPSGASFANMVGIGTTDPTASLHVAGTLRFSDFGAGSLITDSSGNVSVSSDERLKDIQGSFDRGLEEILQLDPILYKWNDTSGMETETTYAGLSAQNVQSVIPEAVDVDSNGYLTLSDRPIMAATINAIKEQQLQIEELKSLITGEGKVLESIEVSESLDIQTTDTGILTQVQTLFIEFKEMIQTLGMTTHTDELGDNYLSIDSDVKMAADLNVLGKTTTSDLTVTGNVQMGLITLDTEENSIDVLGVSCYNEDTGEESEYCSDIMNDPSLSTLYLQKFSSGNLNIFNGKLVIEPNGTMTLDGDFQVKGTIKTEKLIIKDSENAEEGTDNSLNDDSCEEGEISWDDNFIYVCTSEEEWKKSPLYDKDLDIN